MCSGLGDHVAQPTAGLAHSLTNYRTGSAVLTRASHSLSAQNTATTTNTLARSCSPATSHFHIPRTLQFTKPFTCHETRLWCHLKSNLTARHLNQTIICPTACEAKLDQHDVETRHTQHSIDAPPSVVATCVCGSPFRHSDTFASAIASTYGASATLSGTHSCECSIHTLGKNHLFLHRVDSVQGKQSLRLSSVL